MVFSRNLNEKLFPILINRTVVFFFSMCLLTTFLYIAGTAQGFIDSTQLALLRLYIVLGIFLTVISLCGMVLNFGRLFLNKKPRYLLNVSGYIFLVVFGIITVLLASFIITMSNGNL